MHLRGKKDLYRRWNNSQDASTDGLNRGAEEHLTLENYNYFDGEDYEEEEEDEDDDDDEENEDYNKYNPKQRIMGVSSESNSSRGRTTSNGAISVGSSGAAGMAKAALTANQNNNHNHTTSTTTTFLNHKITKTLHHHQTCNGFRNRAWLRKASIKMQLVGLSFALLITGFLGGYIFGRIKGSGTETEHVELPGINKQNHNNNHPSSPPSSHWSGVTAAAGPTWQDDSSNNADSSSFYPHELNETMFHRLINQISVNNIHHNLKRMTQEVHTAGTPEGRSMSIAIRDLWRSYGLSVRVEQYKTLLTRSTTFNYMEVFDSNGSLLFTTSQTGDDVNLPNSVPVLAFSPSAKLNGTLIYGHYGSLEDFEHLNKFEDGKSGLIYLNGSILLVRFSHSHPSEIVSRAVHFGVSALVFYPDPSDFGPMLPGIAVKRDSLLTMAQLHDHQKRRKRLTLPCHTISYNDAERLLSLMRNEARAAAVPAGSDSIMTPAGAFSQQKRLTEPEVGKDGDNVAGSRKLNSNNNNGNGKRKKGRNKNKRNPNLVARQSTTTTTIASSTNTGRFNEIGAGTAADEEEEPFSQGALQLHNTKLHIFNEAKSSSIYNVVASIPGTWESDRYIVIGCSHDSWAYGTGDPGIGLAIMTEIVRVFTLSVQQGWKPRRSILFISFDANLYASNGLFHWLQEHHFEISTRAITFIDLSRVLQGNQTLYIYSSPLLKELVKKTIGKIRRYEGAATTSSSTDDEPTIVSNIRKAKRKPSSSPVPWKSWLDSQNHIYSSTLSSNEPAFAFFGNLGIPFIRLSLSNGPKSYDYPLFHTAFDTYENFVNLVDSTTPNGASSETLGRIISGLILLLTDSSLLPMNVEDYAEQIQKVFESFMVYYQEDLHRANLSIAYLQAAVMRLQVIGDNFRTDVHNRSVINTDQYEFHHEEIRNHSTNYWSNKLLFHRIINDKLMELDRAFLSKKSEFYKHQVIGYSSCPWLPNTRGIYGGDLRRTNKTQSTKAANGYNNNNICISNHIDESSEPSFDNHFPKLRESLNCGRKLRQLHEEEELQQEEEGGRRKDYKNKWEIKDLLEECQNWHSQAAQEITLLIRCLDAAAATLQSPLLPEESDTNNSS